MAIYAVVEDGWVTNIVEWEGGKKWIQETGTAIAVTDPCGIGWKYDGQFFSPPDDAPNQYRNL